jgi:hypothetical protein
MMTYGYSIMDHNDPLIDIVDKATEQFAIASIPGAFLVDTLPFRKHISFRHMLGNPNLTAHIYQSPTSPTGSPVPNGRRKLPNGAKLSST